MHVRSATPEDGEAIRNVVRRSMATAYALAPSSIEAVVAERFDDERVAAATEDDDRRLVVAEVDDAVVGVVDVAHVAGARTGEVRWLHVHPDHQGQGIGRRLFEAARDWLDDAGAEHVRGLSLAENADGDAFYRAVGLECVGEREVAVDGTVRTERVYHEAGREPVSVVQSEGRELFVDREEPSDGSMGPFYVVYADADRTRRYGYQCGHCEGLATAMDSMGRVECEECGNTRRPKRWDAAYM